MSYTKNEFARTETILYTAKKKKKAFSYHVWDASCLAAVVASLAVGALYHPQLPLGEQPHGPDQVLVQDAGNEEVGPSSLPVGRDNAQNKHSD